MRQVGGFSSDIDGDDRTLRERENAARERGDDGDRLLLGPILMQRDLPAGLFSIRVQTGIDVRAARGLADRARVMAMMMLIRISGGETRAAVGPSGRARVMMVMMLIKKRAGGENRRVLIRNRDGEGIRTAFETRGSGENRAAGGFMGRMRNMMMMMLLKTVAAVLLVGEHLILLRAQLTQSLRWQPLQFDEARPSHTLHLPRADAVPIAIRLVHEHESLGWHRRPS